MIAALALSLAIQLPNPVSEVIDPTAKFVSVQAIVRLPPLAGHETAEMAIIADTIDAEVDGFLRRDMKDLASSVGESLKVTLMPDHLRIQFGAPPSGLKPAIGYLNQILRDSHFPVENVNAAIQAIPFRNQSLWASAIQPFTYKFSRMRREDIVDLYHRVCRPENVWLSVGGPIQSGEAADYWQSRMESWKPERPARPSLDQAPLPTLQDLPGRESMIEVRGKEILASDPAIPTRLMAIIALGSGKGSAMFERFRESQGWSYRQEAILWPTAKGFVPRLIMASGDKTPGNELAKSMRDQLTDAVNMWTEADLARARGMAEAILMRGNEMSPLYFNPYWPVTDSLHDRTFMAGYWQMKTGHPWEPSKLLGEMTLLTVSDLKEAAIQMLASSETRFIPARG